MSRRTRVACLSVQLACVILVVHLSAQFSQAQPAQPSIRISGYNIDIVLDPAQHTISAKTAVTFTALRELNAVEFDLNPALQVDGVVDASGHPLRASRVSPDTAELHITPLVPLKSGDTLTWTFNYQGVFAPGDEKADHAPGARFASIAAPVSALLYPARWFPTAGDLTDRFTATIHVHVPAGERVFASGPMGPPHPDDHGRPVFDFTWQQAGFPGTIIAGKFREVGTPDANVRVYLIDSEKANDGQKIASMAAQQYNNLRSQFGPLKIGQLNVIELPNDMVPAYSAPGIAAIAGEQMRGGNRSRLLANTIAHQWWGNAVSPATRTDAWITNGMCRYAELQFIEKSSSHDSFRNAMLNVSASALAYDAFPLSRALQYPDFSPEFEALTYDKGAMIFRMLQWQIGDAAFQQTLHAILSRQAGTISAASLEGIAESASHQDLRPFFTQWLNSTGAPALTNNWTLYRLGENKGFRTIGEITEDLDLFRMPVDVRAETAGRTIDQRIDISGPQSQFVLETPQMPRSISIDPEHWLLLNNPEMQVRVHILRGQNAAARNDDTEAISEYRAALKINNVSSLASYRLGEVYFAQKNYQAGANAFRDALHGDRLPKWTEVWSDLQLGKIFDATGQRERAVNQYSEAVQTGDDTGSAMDLARGYIARAYQPPAQ